MHDRPGKSNFDLIYDLEDPRRYFGTLGELSYKIPHHGQRLFSTLIEAKQGGVGINVVDLCCSYGINASLLKYEVTLEDLYKRYSSEGVASLSSRELAADDAAFFARRMKENPPRVAGVDAAENAVAYGLGANLLDAGYAENLEENDPTDELAEEVSRAGLLTVTGGISYITERTFGRLLACVKSGRLPWVAAFALRSISYEPIARVLSEYGLVTERLSDHTFDQRRFTDPGEREYTLQKLESEGIDPDGKESTGTYHTDFYLSRPADEVEKISVDALLAPALDSDS